MGTRIVDANPARMTILEHLGANGPATATECAELVGLSPSATSYHLRALARAGPAGFGVSPAGSEVVPARFGSLPAGFGVAADSVAGFVAMRPR